MYSDQLSQLGEKPVLNADLWRSPYARPRGFYHPVVVCADASRTRQEFLRDSLIGSIMDRYKVTGQLPGINASRPVITDACSYPDDFQAGMNGLTRIQNEGLKESDFSQGSVQAKSEQTVDPSEVENQSGNSPAESVNS